tara:strand:+ start:37 stop:444 length:408 start_codon:yes stop_codon:yes gene_type:complete
MLDSETIESYKAQQMRTFLEFWMKLCPDHRISIRDGVFGGSGLCIEFSDSFAERIRFNSPAIQEITKTTTYHGSDEQVEDMKRQAEVADRERVLEVQLECDQLRAKADAFDNIVSHQKGMDKHDVCPEKLEPNEG